MMETEHTLKYLVIEDKPDVQQSLVLYLNASSHDITITKNGADAIQQLHQQPFDIIFLDIVLKDMPGSTFLSEVKIIAPETITIVMTPGNATKAGIDAVRAGAWDFVITPITDASLIDIAIHRCLERKHLLDEKKQYQEHLEEAVTERTYQLRKTNETLSREIQERTLAEKKLRLLVTAMEQTAEAIVITDTEHRVQYINPAFTTISGFDANDMIGQNINILKSDEQDACAFIELWDALKQTKDWKGRITNRKKDGSIYHADIIVSPVRDIKGKVTGYVSVQRDITKEVELEKQLRHAQKMEAIGELAGGIAHDFNNLIQAIQGYTDLVMEDLTPEDPRHEDLQQVMKASDSATTLVRQLLTFSRKQPVELKDVDLHTLITRLIRILHRLLGEHIELNLQLHHDTPIIYADPGQIEQVLVNLCINARDAIRDGGIITIRTTIIDVDEPEPERPVLDKGQWLILSIEDNGSGMSADVSTRIFEPFFTTKAEDKGTGLGLAVVYGIIKKHNGHIDVTSELDKGSCFNIYLPIADKVNIEQTQTPSVISELAGNETILFAEDNELVRTITCRDLRNAGYTVIEAENGEEAIQLFSQKSDSFDIAILDVVLPKTNAKVVYKTIKKTRPEMPVLFSSGYAQHILKKHQLIEDSFVIINKPCPSRELLKLVREKLDDQ